MYVYLGNGKSLPDFFLQSRLLLWRSPVVDFAHVRRNRRSILIKHGTLLSNEKINIHSDHS